MSPVMAESRLPVPSLTERELQVLTLIGQGMSNVEIGRKLYLTEHTVKTHCRRLFRKLQVQDRAQAVGTGYQLGVLGPTPTTRPADVPAVTPAVIAVSPVVSWAQVEVLAQLAVNRAAGWLGREQQAAYRARVVQVLESDLRAVGLAVEERPA